MDSREPFEPSKLTRGSTPPKGQLIVWARYLLEPEDLSEIKDIPEAKGSRWLVMGRNPNGVLQSRVEPRPVRNKKPRDGTDKLRAAGFYTA